MKRLFTDLLGFAGRHLSEGRLNPARDRLAVELLESRVMFSFFTWTGANSPNWSDPGNWGENQAPTSTDPEGDDVLFFPTSGVVNFTSVNDIGDVAASQIRVFGNNYTISGSPVLLNASTLSAGGLRVQGNNSTLSNNLELLTTAGTGQLPFEVTGTNQFTLSGTISGEGGLRKNGTGTLVLSADNTYDGTTNVAAGILRVGNGGGTGTLGEGAITVNASLIFNRTGNLTVANNISGNASGSITKANANILTFSGNNTYNGATLIDAGQLTASGGSAIGNNSAVHMSLGTIFNVSNAETIGSLASVAVNATVNLAGILTTGGNNANTEFAGVLNGASGLTKTGTGTMILSGTVANAFAGTTRVNAGRLELAKTGVIAISGPLVIGDGIGASGADEVRLLENVQIVDAAAVTINVTGLLNLNDHFETVGAVTLNGGRIRTGTGSITFGANVTATSNTLGAENQPATIEGNVRLVTSRTFTVNDGPGNTELNVPALISQAPIAGAVGRGINKAGTGRMILGANNTYTGTTNVQRGTLVVNGNQPSRTVVSISGVLAGTGAMGSLTVNPFATVRPGAGQSLTVNGDATLGLFSPATFVSDLVATSFGSLGATGTLALTNTALSLIDVNIPTQPNLLPPLGVPFPILSAAILTGTFVDLPNNAVKVSNSGLSYRVNYTPNNVFVTRVNGPAFGSRAITSPIDEGDNATLTGHITTIFADDTFTLEVNWGDGRKQTFVFEPGASRDVILHHRYRDNGSYNVDLLWRDQRGGFNTDTLAVVVNNVAPQVFAGTDASLLPGRNLVRNGFFVDPGADSWTATVDYGDGTGPQSLRIQGDRFHLRHRYQKPGTYTVTITVLDDDGDAGTKSFVVDTSQLGMNTVKVRG